MKTSRISVLAMAATCYAQSLQNTLSTDLTLVLYDGSSENCDVSNAPTIHFAGFPNTTSICILLYVWKGGNYSLNSHHSEMVYNYTISNGEQITNSSTFTGLWYEQSAGPDNDQAQNPDNVGQLLVRVYPCSGCNKNCRYDPGDLTGLDEWLQWDCIADGTCYDTQEPIRSIWVQAAIDKFDTLDAALQNDKCQMAAAVSTNLTMNNNTELHEDGDNDNGGVALGVSMTGLWAGMALVVGIVALS